VNTLWAAGLRTGLRTRWHRQQKADASKKVSRLSKVVKKWRTRDLRGFVAVSYDGGKQRRRHDSQTPDDPTKPTLVMRDTKHQGQYRRSEWFDTDREGIPTTLSRQDRFRETDLVGYFTITKSSSKSEKVATP